MSIERNGGTTHSEGREDGAQGPVTYAKASQQYGKSISWWRAQARAGRFRVVPFGASEAIPQDEMARIAREGLPPLPRRAPKGKAA
jgi:hypothetical protein